MFNAVNVDVLNMLFSTLAWFFYMASYVDGSASISDELAVRFIESIGFLPRSVNIVQSIEYIYDYK